jgi:hypothetical protein
MDAFVRIAFFGDEIDSDEIDSDEIDSGAVAA